MCKILILDTENLIFSIIEHTLQSEFENCAFLRVLDVASYSTTLLDSQPDVCIVTIKNENELFSGMAAIKTTKETCPGIPVIIIGNTAPDECRKAVLCLRAGAIDYLSLQDLTSIGPVIREVLELQDKSAKQKQKQNITFDAMTEPFAEKTNYYDGSSQSESLETILKESERRYRSFFNTISLGILFIDGTGRIKDINATGCKIVGVERNAILYQTLEDIGLASLMSMISSFYPENGIYSAKEKLCVLKRSDDTPGRILKVSIQPVSTESKGTKANFFVIFEDISEQKKERDELLASEIQYHQLLDVAPVGVLVLSDKTITFCNRQAVVILGAEQSETITGSDFDRLLAPEVRDENRIRLQKTISGEYVKYPIETVFLKIDGLPIDVEVIKARIPYSHGNAELVLFSDITSRKKNERLRRNTETQMQALFRSAPLTMMVVDGNFNVRNINSLDGEKTDDEQKIHPCESGLIQCTNATNKNDTSFDKAQCDHCHLKSAVLATLHTGLELHNREIEIPVIRDNTPINATYLLHASRINDFEEPLCLLVLNDVTEMKDSQKALKNTVTALKVSQERNRRHSRWIQALYSISREITQCTDIAGMISIALSFLEKIFSFRCACVVFPDNDATMNVVQGISKRGSAANKRIGIITGAQFDTNRLPDFFSRCELGKVETFSLLDDPYIGEKYWEGLKNYALKESLTHVVKVPFFADKVKQGMIFLEYDYNVKLSKDEKLFLVDLAENIGMALSNFRLYKELRESYEKLEQAIRSMDKQRRLEAMGQVASGITHDINNTLVPIKLYTEALLEREKGLSEKGKKYLTLIQKSANDIESVTSRLRSFYKGADYTELEPVDINAVLVDVHDMTMPKWKDASNRKGIDIRLIISSDEQIPMVSANASELREALMNLVFNAVDAMPKGGTITLTSKIDGDSVRIAVEDTGTGMSKDVLERCMEPFFTTKGPMGTGLGLAEVYGTINRFKGTINIQSEQGKGTCISINLPRYESIGASIGNTKSDTPSEPMSILLVDDDSRIREVMIEMLSLDGHSVVPFPSASDAIAYLKEETSELPDLIITDLGMPEMDGNNFAQVVKTMHPDLPVFLMTGWGKLLGKEIRADWIDAVINKPPNLETLRSALQTIPQRMPHRGRKQ